MYAMAKGLKTEHGGAKNRGGSHGKRADVKRTGRRARRGDDRAAARQGRHAKAQRYHVVFTPEPDRSAWNVAFVERPDGCGVFTYGRTLALARRRMREALATALDDDTAAAEAEIIERFDVAGAKALASLRERRRKLVEESAEAVRRLRAEGYSERDIKVLMGER